MDKGEYQSYSDAMFEEAENVISTNSNNKMEYNRIHTILQSKEEVEVVIYLSSVKKIKAECEKVKKMKSSYADVFLGFSTLFIGAFFSAILSKIPYKPEFLSIFFYTICPMLGIILGTCFVYFRKKDKMDIKIFAEKVEECFERIDSLEGDK